MIELTNYDTGEALEIDPQEVVLVTPTPDGTTLLLTLFHGVVRVGEGADSPAIALLEAVA